MKKLFTHIILFGFIGFACSGSGEAQDDSVETTNDPDTEIKKSKYINEYGQITLEQFNDTLWNVVFENNEGHQFDTSLSLLTDKDLLNDIISIEDDAFFLKYETGGLLVSEDRIGVIEFTGIAKLAIRTKIDKLYLRPFYRSDQEVEISGDLKRSKGGITLKDIYLIDDKKIYDDGYYILKGNIEKEPYPQSFYSTDESPQGIFPDDGKKRYRLASRVFEIQQPKSEIYTGYPVNTSNKKAAIAWELADSEAFILEGHETWTEEELNKKITVEGYLVQNNRGSFLKNWKIVDGH